MIESKSVTVIYNLHEKVRIVFQVSTFELDGVYPCSCVMKQGDTYADSTLSVFDYSIGFPHVLSY